MKTFTKIVAVAALLASTSSLALAQVSVGVGTDAGGSVSVGSGSDSGTSVGVDTGVDAGLNAGTGSGDSSGSGLSGEANASGSANANASSSGNASNSDINFGSIVSSLRTSSTTAADIETVDSDAQITIVTLSEIQGSAAEGSNAIEQAINDQEDSLSDLSVAIQANAEISAALDAEGFSSDDVVAVTSAAEGDLTIIVDDTSS